MDELSKFPDSSSNLTNSIRTVWHDYSPYIGHEGQELAEKILSESTDPIPVNQIISSFNKYKHLLNCQINTQVAIDYEPFLGEQRNLTFMQCPKVNGVAY